MCGVSISQYRARVGHFHDTAFKSSQNYIPFLHSGNIYPFLILLFKGKDGLPISLLLFLILSYEQNHPKYCGFDFKSHSKDNNVSRNYRIDLYVYTIALFCFCLLMLCGDIHPNPGPAPHSKLRMVHCNCASLQNKAYLIEAELNSFDIITVSETWLYRDFDPDRIRIEGYYPPLRKDREDGTAWGGVAIYVKNNLICKPRPDLEVAELEAVWVETKLNQETFLVGSFYRPPDALVSYWDLINDSIKLAMNTPHKLVILGDFNADCKDSVDPHVQRLLNDNCLVQIIREPTHFQVPTGTLIDLILTPNYGIVEKSGVLAPVCSKHSCPFVDIVNNIPKTTKVKRTIYNYSKLNVEKFKEELLVVNWDNIATAENIEMAADFFTRNLLAVARRCMPSKTVTDRSNDKPWITDELKNSIIRKEIIYKMAKEINTIWSWELFKRCRNDLTNKIRTRKQEYRLDIENKINTDETHGSKIWWKLVNQFTIKKGLSSSEIPPIQFDNKVYYLPEEKAEVFNQHFVNNSTLNGTDDELPILEEGDVILPQLVITEEMILDVIKNLNPNKAVGPDFVHNKLLIKAADVIVKPLNILLNRSLNEEKFPASWKLANVTPIYKKGERDLCSNYRPVSLLSCVGKIMERCVQNHVFGFLKSNNLLTSCQSGFIPGDSTTFQLLVMYDDFCKSLDNKLTTQSVFFDISKAFEKVWHKGLIYKLHCIGIRGKMLKWFSDYLIDRKQAVVIKGKTSSYKSISSGVPQGSVLGPLLFLIYINDIVKDIESIVKLFADDTSMYLSLEDTEERSRLLNSDLNKITNWSVKWKVDFHPLKTELMNFCNKRVPDTLPLLFGQQALNPSSNHKHLGVIFQNNCKWDSHIEALIVKTRLLVACLRSYKYQFSRRTLTTIYKSFILPHFDYADVVWDNCTDRLCDELESLHLDAIRTIIGAVRGTSHAKLYSESGFISLKERRRRHKLITYFKALNGFTPGYLTNYIPPLASSINPYPTRSSPLARAIPLYKTTLYEHSFFISTTYLWNELPDNYKLTNSISNFKRLLRKDDVCVPSFYLGGDRYSEIIHCKLRLEISDLQDDLVKRHLANYSTCRCGHHCENAHHYLFDCPLFDEARSTTLHHINPIDHRDFTLDCLLYGNPARSTVENMQLFECVKSYISKSNRFT